MGAGSGHWLSLLVQGLYFHSLSVTTVAYVHTWRPSSANGTWKLDIRPAGSSGRSVACPVGHWCSLEPVYGEVSRTNYSTYHGFVPPSFMLLMQLSLLISFLQGAPEVWQASFTRNRALDRAILRYLIGAHLDDLRALENSTAGNPKVTRRMPTTGGAWGSGLTRTASARVRNRRDGGEWSWADVIVPLLSGQVSRARGGPADEHVDAILCLIREISWRAGRSTGSMSHEEAEEVVTEAKRRLPVSETASASAGNLIDYDEHRHVDDDTQPWGAGGEGMKVRRAPWPWGPRTVPASAVGAVLALAAALPPAGKLLAGLDVMLQVGSEVIAAAKAEAAASAGAVAAASGSAGKGVARGGLASASPKNAANSNAGEAHASVEEVSCAAERALLLYTSEYCGKDPDKWASVTEHVRNTSDGEGHEGGGLTWGEGVNDAGQKLVRALLRRCGEELGGEALVRALPASLDLMDCLDEVERSLLND